jgi:serine/threonine protein kinase/Flp pilus assembly protein TadD
VTENKEDITKAHVIFTKGTQVQHYEIIDKIGAGGMGEVYLCEDTKLNRRVALKFLPAHMSQDKDIQIRFRREAQAVAKLEHPNIVAIYEVSEFNGQPFFSMQYVEGEILNHYCQDEALSISKIISIVSQIAEGLGKAHDSGVIHRDIKSSNIIVNKELRPKILDFGLATVKGTEMLTKVGSTLGTIAYMSPEQAQGLDVDHRTDLFSLGVVFYELIAGRIPFKRDNDPATLNAIINDEPEPLARYKSDVSSDIQRIVSRCLAKNPNERYQSAVDLAADLRFVGNALNSSSSGSSIKKIDSRPSLAVLPFANMSADPENEYFSDGLTEELLNVLAKNPELKVTGRTSSFAFKGKQEDLRGIGQKLGVATLLEGSVRKSGNRIRITAQLVNTTDGFHLWTETYDRVLEDIFEVQDDIAAAVAKELQITLLGGKSESHNNNPESYALILRANHSTNQMSKSGFNVAIELFQRALDIDPNNAKAWGGIARAYALKAAFGYADVQEYYGKSKDAAQHALGLDDTLAEALEVIGWIAAFEYDLEQAENSFRKAYSLAPNNSRMVSSLSLFESMMGNFEESIRLSKLSLEIDPLNPEAYLNQGKIYLWSEKLDKAITSFNKAIEISPNMTSVYLNIGWVYILKGKYDDAVTSINREKLGGYQDCGLTMAYHSMGKKDESDKALARLLTHGNEWGAQFAAAYAFRNEKDKAFEWLERSVELQDSGVLNVYVFPLYKNLHNDSRWLPFLKKVGFVK